MGIMEIHVFKYRVIKFNITEVSICEIRIENLSVVKIDLSQRCIAKVSQLDGAVR